MSRRYRSGLPLSVVLIAVVILSPASHGQGPAFTAAALPEKFLFQFGRDQPAVGQFTEPNAISVGPYGTVYVLDTASGRVQYFSANGDFLGAWGATGTGDGQLGTPQGIAAGPDATVYVSDSGNVRVQRFGATGQVLGKWPTSGLYSQPPGVKSRGLAVGPGGAVYVVDSWGFVLKFSSGGTFLGVFVGYRPEGGGNKYLSSPSAIAVAPDGTVYVCDTSGYGYTQMIKRFGPDGTYLGQWGPVYSPAAAFGLAAAPDGTVYVSINEVATPASPSRILHLSAEGTLLQEWGGAKGFGDGQFGGSTALAVAPSGAVYVADTANARVQQFTATGGFVRKWGSSGAAASLNAPRGIAIGAGGTTYVFDSGNYRVERYSSLGAVLGAWGSPGTGDGQFGNVVTPETITGPAGVAVASGGDVYVADTRNHRVQQFTSSGQFVRKWGSEGTGNGQFRSPSAVAVAPNGTVYVADTLNARVQYFGPDGTYVGQWGSAGSGDGLFGLNWPLGISGIAVAPDDTVYVADTLNSRVQRFSPTGGFLGKWGVSGDANGQFLSPRAVAVGADGTVYVADPGNARVQAFSLEGTFLGKWGAFGAGEGEFGRTYNSVYHFYDGIRGIAAGTDGTVWVADTDNSRIQVFGAGYLSNWRGEYHANLYMADAPALVREDASLNFDWGFASPCAGIPADGFSARWGRYIWSNGGPYRFVAWSDGGIRVRVDGKLIIEHWGPQSGVLRDSVGLSVGWHRVEVEYRHFSGAAGMGFDWAAMPRRAFLPVVERPAE